MQLLWMQDCTHRIHACSAFVHRSSACSIPANQTLCTPGAARAGFVHAAVQDLSTQHLCMQAAEQSDVFW